MFDVSVNEAKIGCGGVHRKAMIAFDEVKLGPTAHRPLPVVLVQPLNIFTETVNGPPILANGSLSLSSMAKLYKSQLHNYSLISRTPSLSTTFTI
jgi:hypothetical protein